MSKHINGKMKFVLNTPLILAVFTVFTRFPFIFIVYLHRFVVSITMCAIAPRFGKWYLIFTVLEGLLIQVYVGDVSGTVINVKTEFRKSFNPRTGNLKISFTISAVLYFKPLGS